MDPKLRPEVLCYVRNSPGHAIADPTLVGRVVLTQQVVQPGDSMTVDTTRVLIKAVPDNGPFWWVTGSDGGSLTIMLVHGLTGHERSGVADRVFLHHTNLVPIAGPGLELPCSPVTTPLPQPAEAL